MIDGATARTARRSMKMATILVKPFRSICQLLLLILQSFDWLAAFHLEMLQAILVIAV